MTETLAFYLFAGWSLAGALGVVVLRNPIGSALSLVGCFFGLACLYALLNAEFVAVMQILVYAGAVMVLFLFVIMLLNLGTEVLKRARPSFVSLLGILVGGYLLALLVLRLGAYQDAGAPALSAGFGSVAAVGTVLFSRYLVPLEATGLLLLVAVVGAIALAKKD